MRRSTLVILLVFLACSAGLVVLILLAGQPEFVRGKRIYRFAAWGGAEEMAELRDKVLAPINAAAEDFHIELIAVPGDYNTKLLTMIASGTPPDLFYLSQEHIPRWAESGALLDLTRLIAEDRQDVFDLADYYPAVLNQYRHRGRLFGLPWIAQPVVMYCNVELFDAVQGVDLPDDSWDWDRFVQAGKKLTRDTDGDGRIDTWATVVHRWPPVQIWIWQAGGRLFDKGTGRLDLTSPAVLRGARFKADLIHRYRIAPPIEQIDAGIHDLFRAGRVAMFFGGAADDLDRQKDLPVAVRRVPSGPGGRATFAWSAGLCLSPGVADRDQALVVYRKLLAGLQQWKVPAPRRSLAARLEQIEPRKAHAAAVIRSAMEHMRAPHSLGESARFDDLFWEEFESPLLRNRGGAEDLAETAQATIREQL